MGFLPIGCWLLPLLVALPLFTSFAVRYKVLAQVPGGAKYLASAPGWQVQRSRFTHRDFPIVALGLSRSRDRFSPGLSPQSITRVQLIASVASRPSASFAHLDQAGLPSETHAASALYRHG